MKHDTAGTRSWALRSLRNGPADSSRIPHNGLLAVPPGRRGIVPAAPFEREGVIVELRASRFAVAIAALGLSMPSATAAAEKTVAEEILEVLRAQGAISEEQYEDWSRRAREERAGGSESASADAAEAEDEREPLVIWRDGLRVRPNRDVELQIGGRVYADYAYFDADDDTVAFFDDDDLDGGSGTEFSRARIFVAGKLQEIADFKAEFDFGEGSDVEMKDVFAQLNSVPWVNNVRAGHFKEPYTLQRLISSRHIQFMERSVMNTFSANRNMGIMLFDTALDERMTWSLGGFLDVDSAGFDFQTGGNHHLAARLTGIAFQREEGRKLLHLGFSYLHRFVGDSIRFFSKPESNLSPVEFVDTGTFSASHVDQITPELALVWGPFSLQTEYTLALVDSDSTGDPTFDGFYVEGSWFLTGEHRPYVPERGIFGSVRPARNFDLRGGLGAWQLALRYSWVDLADGAFRDPSLDPPEGRRLDNISVGLNWYLNPYLRMMVNYIRADLQDVGDTNIVQSRLQFDF